MTEKQPTHYELVRADGVISPMKFDTAEQAAKAAGRTGKGWDVQIAGLRDPE